MKKLIIYSILLAKALGLNDSKSLNGESDLDQKPKQHFYKRCSKLQATIHGIEGQFLICMDLVISKDSQKKKFDMEYHRANSIKIQINRILLFLIEREIIKPSKKNKKVNKESSSLLGAPVKEVFESKSNEDIFFYYIGDLSKGFNQKLIKPVKTSYHYNRSEEDSNNYLFDDVFFDTSIIKVGIRELNLVKCSSEDKNMSYTFNYQVIVTQTKKSDKDMNQNLDRIVADNIDTDERIKNGNSESEFSKYFFIKFDDMNGKKSFNQSQDGYIRSFDEKRRTRVVSIMQSNGGKQINLDGLTSGE